MMSSIASFSVLFLTLCEKQRSVPAESLQSTATARSFAKEMATTSLWALNWISAEEFYEERKENQRRKKAKVKNSKKKRTGKWRHHKKLCYVCDSSWWRQRDTLSMSFVMMTSLPSIPSAATKVCAANSIPTFRFESNTKVSHRIQWLTRKPN